MSETQSEQTASAALDGAPAIYRLPASKKSLKQNQFEFQLVEDGPVLSMPKLKFIRPKLAVEIEELPLQQAVLRLFEEFHPGLIDQFEDSEQFENFTRAWALASGIDLGKSTPSSDSSESTEGLPSTTSGNTATA